MNNTLRKSNHDSIIFGVCGGLAEYFNMDSTIVRLILVGFTLLGGSGLLIYLIASLIMKSAV